MAPFMIHKFENDTEMTRKMSMYSMTDQELKDREHFMRELFVEIQGNTVNAWELYTEHKRSMVDDGQCCISCGRHIWQVGVLRSVNGHRYCDNCAPYERIKADAR